MAKANMIKIKLLSSADTGYFYVTKKNSRTKTDKLVKKKYDPIAKKHVEFRETKIKSVAPGSRGFAGRRKAPSSFWGGVAHHRESGRPGMVSEEATRPTIPDRPAPRAQAIDLSNPWGVQGVGGVGGTRPAAPRRTLPGRDAIAWKMQSNSQGPG